MMMNLEYECPTDGEIRTIPFEDVKFASDAWPCDLCGVHGYVEMEVYCACGTLHTETVKDY